MKKEKIYKEKKNRKDVILLGDPQGLPDDFGFFKYNFWSSSEHIQKLYKVEKINSFDMFPSDPSGSLDVFFLGGVYG